MSGQSENRGRHTGKRQREQRNLERRLVLRNRWYAGGIATVLSAALMFTGYMPAAMADDGSTAGTQSSDATPTDAPSPSASPSSTDAPNTDSSKTDSSATDSSTADTSETDTSKTDASTDAATPTPTPTPSPSETTKAKTQLKSVQKDAVVQADAVTTGTIKVHAGDIRTGSGISGVTGLNGATYTATATTSGSGGPFSCVTDSSGICTITGLPLGFRWDVTASGAASNHYLSGKLDVGNSSSGTATDYEFRTDRINSATIVDVPGATYGQGSGNYYEDGSNNKFSGLFAQSLNNPAGPMQQCGINIALVLDQSGSMALGGKQTSLTSAAKSVITALTGTPSSIAVYSFASTTGSSVGKTSTATTASAAPLLTYINGLGTPNGSTNWDAGLSQVPGGYDLVILLTDGNPTTAGNGSYDGDNDVFGYVEQGIFSANKVKNQGERLVAIGIGVAGGAENLRALTGPTADSDYFLESNTSFGDTLKTLATGACSNTITVNKKIEDADGNVTAPSAANGWDFSGTTTQGSIGGAGVFPATATVNGINGVTQQTITLPQSPAPTIKITENPTSAQASGYTLDTAKSTCTVGGSNATITWTDSTASFTGAANEPIVCNFVNKVVPTYTVTVVKNWAANAISGDRATLSLTGTAGGTSTAPTDGTSVSNAFQAGASVTIGEAAVAGNKGVYTPTLTCTGGITPDVHGKFTMPAKDITCTYLNTNATGTITLIKRWKNAIIGDSATLTIGSDTGTTSTVSNNTGSSFTDSANADSATAPVGSNVTIKEVLTGSGVYDTSYVCVDSTGKKVASGSTTSGSVPVKAGKVTCTITNEACLVKVTLHKTWENAIAGDKTTLSLEGNGLSDSFTSSAQSGASWTDGQTATITVPVNTTITIGESAVTNGSGGAAGGSYSQTYACGAHTGSTSYTVTADTDCTITNVNKGVTILLQKDWVSSVNGDTADLLINGTKGATSTGLGSPTNQLDLTNVAQQQVHVGDTVSIGETLHSTGEYTSTYTCTASDGSTVASGSTSSGSFQVPAGAAGSNITCVIFNTAPAKWTVHKSSVDVNNGNTSGEAMPGDRIDYTITITHVSGSWPSAGLVQNTLDDLSNLLSNSALQGAPIASLGAVSIDSGTHALSWSVTGADLQSHHPATITVKYSVKVNADAWQVQLPNYLTPSNSVYCVDGDGQPIPDAECGSTYETPKVSLWKTSKVTDKADPSDSTKVLPGGTVEYTLHAENTSDIVVPAGQTETDDLTGVLVHGATLGTLPAGLVLSDPDTLTWTLPQIAAGGEVTVTFSVKVGPTSVPGGYDLVNTLVPGTVGTCPSDEPEEGVAAKEGEAPSCTTTNHVPYLDLGIVKTASTAGPVDDDPGTSSEFSYALKVTNNSDEDVTDGTVTDTLPDLISLDTSKGTDGFDLPAGWTASVAGQKITVTIPALAVGASGTITVYVLVKPAVSTVSSVEPGAAPPLAIPPADTIDNTACVALTGDQDATNDCSTVKVPQKAVFANLWVQCQGDIPYLGYDIRTTANIASEPVTLTWTASQPGTGGVPSTDLPPDPEQVVKTLHSGDSGRLLWPGGEVDQNVGVGFPGWRPIVESDYNADGTLKFPASLTFAGLVYDPSTVATDAWRYESTVTIKVNPTTTATVTYPPATPKCAVARIPEVSITKTASVTSTSPGSSYSYDLAVKNNGLGAASPMTVTDKIPADLMVTGISTSTTAFPRWQDCEVTGKDASGYGGTLSCDLFGPLTLNESAPRITVFVTVNKGTTVDTITNTATVNWTNMDNPNNTGSDKSSVTVDVVTGTLAVTGGTPAFGLIGLGLFVLLAGVGVLIVTRRRRHGEQS